MDNVTHSLVGLAMARAGLNRFSPRATLLLILSANAPDIDIVALSRGGLAYLEAHRGYTHSLLGLPAMALLSVLVVAAIYRERLPWLNAWLLCCAGVGGHLLIDWTNSYGIRLLLPFSSRWFHLDWTSLFDTYILAILVFAAVWPSFARLVSGEIGDRTSPGRGIAIFALVFLALFDGTRAVLHLRVVAQMQSRLYADAPALQAVAVPDPFTPVGWTGIVETAADYRVMPLNAFGQLNVENATRFYKPAVTAALEHAKKVEAFRYFLYFARFPVWSQYPVTVNGQPGKRLDLTDLPFGRPGRGSFHCIALEDARDEVLQSWFTYGSGANLGWGDAGSR